MRHFRLIFISAILAALSTVAAGQGRGETPIKSQEISELDGVPVLLKHLPDYEQVRSSAVFTTNVEDLRPALGDRAILELIDFSGGTEAVMAPYTAGRLLIVEYSNPQLAAEADTKFSSQLATDPGDPPVVYRRIGNYSAFVFDASDTTAANFLLDQVKYEKTVQWLGKDPFTLEKLERYFAVTSRDIAISTVLWILGGLFLALAVGVVCGLIYYQYRERARMNQTAFSDAGGLTRLNLDDLSEPIKSR